MNQEVSRGLIEGLSKSTGVNEESVQKILNHLGFAKSLEQAQLILGPDRLGMITLENIEVGFRVGHTCIQK